MPDLRKEFFSAMENICEQDPDIMLIVGDLGFGFSDRFKTRFSGQFLNFGIAEQAMVGVAAGMARRGKKPFVYSGTVFLLMRAYEQVRDDVAFNKTNVKLIGTGAAGFLGFTHNLTGTENEEDLLKNLPIKRFYPKNANQLTKALAYDGPAFIRI